MIADPYVASPVLPNHGGLVARHALRTPVGQEPGVAKTLQRTVPPNPQIAFAVFKDAPNAVGADFAVIAAERRQTALFDPGQSRRGSYPHAPGLVHGQRVHRFMRQALTHAESGHLGIFTHQDDSMITAHPQPVGTLPDSVDVFGFQNFWPENSDELVAGALNQTSGAAHPKLILRVFVDYLNRLDRSDTLAGEQGDFAVIESDQ